MTMAELETAVREGARVVVIVFDNERYGTIRMWQERRGTGQGVATELGPFDFAAVARARSARAGVRVDADAEFEPARSRHALAADRPTVIQLALDRAGSRSTSQPRPSDPARRSTSARARRGTARRGIPDGHRTRPPRSRPRASSTAPTASTRWARRSIATTPTTRERSSRSPSISTPSACRGATTSPARRTRTSTARSRRRRS